MKIKFLINSDGWVSHSSTFEFFDKYMLKVDDDYNFFDYLRFVCESK